MKKSLTRVLAVVTALALSTSALAQLIQRPRDPNTNKTAGIAYAVDCSVDLPGPVHGEVCVEIAATAAGVAAMIFGSDTLDMIIF